MECPRHKELNQYQACFPCWYDKEVYPRVRDLLEEIAKLESQRDRIGRHTNMSAHCEALMSTHAKLFDTFGIKQLTPKNAL